MTCGIYAIRSDKYNKLCVGKTVNIQKRFQAHISLLLRGAHHNKYIQNDWDENGSTSISFIFIEECDPRNLDIQEKYWIEKLNTLYPNGYNLPNAVTGKTANKRKFKFYAIDIKDKVDE